MYGLARALLFRIDPERAHGLAMRYLRRVHRSERAQERWRRRRGPPDPRLRMHALGRAFEGPMGVAAGFDKGAEAYNALLALGFSHVEVGTITPEPQEGNPRPRLERHRDHRALVNRMGFNNPGADTAAERLAQHPARGAIGLNVGKNRSTPEERVVEDYLAAGLRLAPHGDYLAVNVSSPNTPGLRALQEPEGVANLVGRLLEALDDAGAARPVAVKLHPDGPDEALLAVARAALDAGAAGLIAVNTTVARPAGLEGAGAGGLSGAPLKARALEALTALSRGLDGEGDLLGVGGIETGQDVLERVRAGASLVQAYTGFIYRGPRFAEVVHREVLAGLDEAGIDRLEELRGQGSG